MTTNFGRDTSCGATLRTGRLSSGVRLVAENAYHRLTTPRGMLRGGEDEQNYGLDLAEYIGAQADAAVAATLPGVIRNELLKDERIDTVDVQVSELRTSVAVSYEITVECLTAEGPFQLQIAASSVSTALLGITVQEAA